MTGVQTCALPISQQRSLEPSVRFKRGDVLLLFIEFCSGAFCESGKNIFAFCFYFKVMEIVSDPRSVFDE